MEIFMITLNHRLSSLALGLMLASTTALPMAFAQDNTTQTGGTTSQAQGWKHHGMHHGCEAMKQLGLTDQQKQQLKEAHKTFKEQNSAAIESLKAKHQQLKQLGKDQANQAQRQQLLSEIKQERSALMEKKKASMQGILTPEQQSKWETLKQQCKAQHSGKWHGKNQGNQS
jgi:Spy/CpxP family protein refolding chaperone